MRNMPCINTHYLNRYMAELDRESAYEDAMEHYAAEIAADLMSAGYCNVQIGRRIARAAPSGNDELHPRCGQTRGQRERRLRRIVAAQQGHLLATCFHPELTGDERFHRYFLEL